MYGDIECTICTNLRQTLGPIGINVYTPKSQGIFQGKDEKPLEVHSQVQRLRQSTEAGPVHWVCWLSKKAPQTQHPRLLPRNLSSPQGPQDIEMGLRIQIHLLPLQGTPWGQGPHHHRKVIGRLLLAVSQGGVMSHSRAGAPSVTPSCVLLSLLHPLSHSLMRVPGKSLPHLDLHLPHLQDERGGPDETPKIFWSPLTLRI